MRIWEMTSESFDQAGKLRFNRLRSLERLLHKKDLTPATRAKTQAEVARLKSYIKMDADTRERMIRKDQDREDARQSAKPKTWDELNAALRART